MLKKINLIAILIVSISAFCTKDTQIIVFQEGETWGN